jgi:hypothetical protein
MSKKLRNIFLILIGGAYIGIGYLRDFLFVNINFAIKKMRSGEEFQGHSFMEFLKDFEPSTLFASKFVLTGAFTVLNFLPGAFALFLLFSSRLYLRWFLYLYVVVLLVSLAFYGGGYLLGAPQQGYSLARLFMGFLQSPVPAMIFVPLCWLHRKERRTNPRS